MWFTTSRCGRSKRRYSWPGEAQKKGQSRSSISTKKFQTDVVVRLSILNKTYCMIICLRVWITEHWTNVGWPDRNVLLQIPVLLEKVDLRHWWCLACTEGRSQVSSHHGQSILPSSFLRGEWLLCWSVPSVWDWSSSCNQARSRFHWRKGSSKQFDRRFPRLPDETALTWPDRWTDVLEYKNN